MYPETQSASLSAIDISGIKVLLREEADSMHLRTE